MEPWLEVIVLFVRRDRGSQGLSLEFGVGYFLAGLAQQLLLYVVAGTHDVYVNLYSCVDIRAASRIPKLLPRVW